MDRPPSARTAEHATGCLTTPATRRRVLAAVAGLAGLALPSSAARAVPPNPIRVTGGGWLFDTLTNAKVTVGFQVRQLPPSPILPPNPIRGTFELHDHATGFRFHSNLIDVLAVGGNSAHFEGEASSSGLGEGTQRFLVDVTEGGEEEDPFLSFLAGDTAIAGTLRGGSIKIHGQEENAT